MNLAIKVLPALHWRHNDHDGVSNHQPHGCLLNCLFRRRPKKTSNSASLALCGEFTGTGEFPAQRASDAENVSIWWRHHVDSSSSNGSQATCPIKSILVSPTITTEVVSLPHLAGDRHILYSAEGYRSERLDGCRVSKALLLSTP